MAKNCTADSGDVPSVQSDGREALRDTEGQLVAGGELSHPFFTVAAIAHAHELVAVRKRRGLQAGNIHTHRWHRGVYGESPSREVCVDVARHVHVREENGCWNPSRNKRIDDLARYVEIHSGEQPEELPSLGAISVADDGAERGAVVSRTGRRWSTSV
jgi:hypothetical protein